jgi:outer membrane biosynthesis protein TonB
MSWGHLCRINHKKHILMKKSILITVLPAIACILLLTSFKASAQGIAREDVKNMVVKAIEYPEAAIEKKIEGEVVVSFYATDKGKIEVSEIFSRDPILQEYVYDQITALQVPAENAAETDPIVLRFTFKLL